MDRKRPDTQYTQVSGPCARTALPLPPLTVKVNVNLKARSIIVRSAQAGTGNNAGNQTERASPESR